MNTGYRSDVASDAQDTAREFVDQIIESIIDDGKASDDLLNDYGNGDAYHHESHVDKSYDLKEAAAILDDLSEHEETDSGLWEGLAPREAISAQAAYTYGNAVYDGWRSIIESINDDSELQALKSHLGELDDTEPGDESEISELKAAIGRRVNAVINEA